MSTNAGPQQVLLIRHGEKLGDPKKHDDGGFDLSIRGSARAAALPSLFASASPSLSCTSAQTQAGFNGSYSNVQLPGQTPRFPRPDFIIASQRSKHSNRPVETIIPLAAALGMGYNDKHANEEYPTVAHHLLTHEQYAGKIILACWHHGKVPEFAQALGVSNPPDWPDHIFDRIWQITYAGGKGTLENLPQMLLFGDSSS